MPANKKLIYGPLYVVCVLMHRNILVCAVCLVSRVVVPVFSYVFTYVRVSVCACLYYACLIILNYGFVFTLENLICIVD